MITSIVTSVVHSDFMHNKLALANLSLRQRKKLVHKLGDCSVAKKQTLGGFWGEQTKALELVLVVGFVIPCPDLMCGIVVLHDTGP